MKNLFLAVSVLLASFAYGQDASVKKLIKLAEKGDVKAQSELADAYLKGKGVKRSFQDAALWLEKVAQAGDAQAQYQLAHLYLEGKGVSKSDENAAEWLSKAAKNGNLNAEQELALCYRDGRGVPQSNAKYYAWIEKNADNEKAETLLDLAKAYYAGDGVTKDVNKAKFWAQKATKKGSHEADFLLATWMYEINPSNPEAIQRLIQVAEKGDADAQTNHRHRTCAHFLARQVGQQRRYRRAHRACALQGTSHHQHQPSVGGGGGEAAGGKQNQAEINRFLAAEAVGSDAQRQLH